MGFPESEDYCPFGIVSCNSKYVAVSKNKTNELRFSITDNGGHRAATWKVISPKSKSDIYISCRELRGTIKTSLHQSGSWHVGFSKEASEYHFDSDEVKYIEIWDRPQPIMNGVTLALKIITPFSAVTSTLEESTKEMVQIPNCEDGFATEIALIVTSPFALQSGWPGKTSMNTSLVGTFKLANDETVWIVYRTIPLPNFGTLIGKEFSLLKGRNETDLTKGNLRAMIFGDGDDNSRVIIDCVVQKTKE
jgi:hypothetical protein